jgi:hypothetical protein
MKPSRPTATTAPLTAKDLDNNCAGANKTPKLYDSIRLRNWRTIQGGGSRAPLLPKPNSRPSCDHPPSKPCPRAGRTA